MDSGNDTFREWLQRLAAETIAGSIAARRRLNRSGDGLRHALHRLRSHTRRAAAAQSLSHAAFHALGYRWWWRLHPPAARPCGEGANLVVIGGSPRSGTTLLRSILGRHSQIHAGAETTVFLRRISSPADLAERLDWNAADIEHWQHTSPGQAQFVARCAAAVLARAGKAVWVEKTPHNVRRFGFVHRHFPRARLVHVVRDGRDVVCSLRREAFSKIEHAAWDSPEAARACALQWRRAVAAGLRWRGHPAYHEIRYEDLVRTPEPVLRALLDFLGLPWEPAMLTAVPAADDGHETKAASRIFRHSIGRWQSDLPSVDRAAIGPLVQPVLVRLGYASSKGWAGGVEQEEGEAFLF